MSIDIIWIAGALLIPLVGVAFSMLRNRVDKIEENARTEIKDLQIWVRHEIRTINTTLIASLTEDRQFAINKLVTSLETVAELLQNRSVTEIEKVEKAKKVSRI